MKKLILTFAFAAVSASTYAAQFAPQSFLAVQAVYVTNAIPVTNLLTTGASLTNVVGTSYTNGNVRVTTTSTVGIYQNMLQDVMLWPDLNGRPWGIDHVETNSLGGGNLLLSPYQITPMNVSVTMSGGSGANTAVQFFMAALPDGVNEDTSGYTTWNFAFTPTASATKTFVTNAPAWLWQGCGKLRLKAIVNGDTDATSHVIIRAINLNGFIP